MTDEKLLPLGETTPPATPIAEPSSEKAAAAPLVGIPSSAQQSWGTLVSIVVIVLMIIVGAFYAWGNRIAQNQQIAPAAVQ